MADKTFKTIDELSVLLVKERGLECEDVGDLERFLRLTNYYRFSGYAREFQINPRYGDSRFLEDTSFSKIRTIYHLDNKLRQLLLEQLGIIEIAIRAALAYEYGRVYGPAAFYLNVGNYQQGRDPLRDKPTEIVTGFLNDFDRDKSTIIPRYSNRCVGGKDFESRLQKYSNVPIWAAVEVVSFGRISNMLNYSTNVAPAKAAAALLGVQWVPFPETVHAFSVLRNL
jgi:abortive infection bacteriophage resistance protein